MALTWGHASAVIATVIRTVMTKRENAWCANTTPRANDVSSVCQVSMVMPELESQLTVNLVPAQEQPPQISFQRLVSWTQMESQRVIIAPVASEAGTVKDVLQDTLGIPHLGNIASLQIIVLVTGEAALKLNVMLMETARASPMWKARLVTVANMVISS